MRRQWGQLYLISHEAGCKQYEISELFIYRLLMNCSKFVVHCSVIVCCSRPNFYADYRQFAVFWLLYLCIFSLQVKSGVCLMRTVWTAISNLVVFRFWVNRSWWVHVGLRELWICSATFSSLAQRISISRLEGSSSISGRKQGRRLWADSGGRSPPKFEGRRTKMLISPNIS
jgi:hypothetical protein